MRREAVALMRRYMTCIYGMTTVNHDHLLASLLRRTPYSRIDPVDLCRRAFLLADRLQKCPELCLHAALAEDQTHLLVDDPHGIVKDFMDMALEKGNLKNGTATISGIVNLFLRPTAFIGRVSTTPSTSWPTRSSLFGSSARSAAQRLPAGLLDPPAGAKSSRARGGGGVRGGLPALRRSRRVQTNGRWHAVSPQGPIRPARCRPLHGYMAAPLEVKGLAEFLGRQGYWVYARGCGGMARRSGPGGAVLSGLAAFRRSGYAIMSSICRRVVAGGFFHGSRACAASRRTGQESGRCFRHIGPDAPEGL